MTIDDFVRARDRLTRAVERDLPVDGVFAELIASLHEVARFDRCVLVLTDPETMLPFGGTVEEFDADSCVPFWDNELLDPDFMKFADLGRSSDPVATLFEATDGDLERSPRYRKLLAPLGAADELRLALTAGSACWAAGTLVRPGDAGPFGPEEVRAVRDLVPVAARAIRNAVTKRDFNADDIGPAMLVVSGDGHIESATAEAEALVADLPTQGVPMELPTAILGVARRAKSSRSRATVALRARGVSGRWLKVHASPLGDDGRVAVMIEAARPSDLVPILLESYGLTARETEIVLRLSRGLSTKSIATELLISEHTVRDHIKVIFTKCGVSSRGELVASLFSQHLHAAHHAAVTHV